MNALIELRGAGFNLSLNEKNGIVISPASKLTERQRKIIRENKMLIAYELKLEKTYLHWHVVTPTDDTNFSVIPKSTLAEIKVKFPNAIIIEPVETMQ